MRKQIKEQLQDNIIPIIFYIVFIGYLIHIFYRAIPSLNLITIANFLFRNTGLVFQTIRTIAVCFISIYTISSLSGKTAQAKFFVSYLPAFIELAILQRVVYDISVNEINVIQEEETIKNIKLFLTIGMLCMFLIIFVMSHWVNSFHIRNPQIYLFVPILIIIINGWVVVFQILSLDPIPIVDSIALILPLPLEENLLQWISAGGYIVFILLTLFLYRSSLFQIIRLRDITPLKLEKMKEKKQIESLVTEKRNCFICGRHFSLKNFDYFFLQDQSQNAQFYFCSWGCLNRHTCK